jgi:hypothetical protein
MGRFRLVEIPHDFPNFTGDRNVALADTLSTTLLWDRDLIGDSVWRQTAIDRIERVRRYEFVGVQPLQLLVVVAVGRGGAGARVVHAGAELARFVLPLASRGFGRGGSDASDVACGLRAM